MVGWMMAMKAHEELLSPIPVHWTTGTTLNTSDNTRNDADAKFNTMNYYHAKDIMALWARYSLELWWKCHWRKCEYE